MVIGEAGDIYARVLHRVGKRVRGIEAGVSGVRLLALETRLDICYRQVSGAQVRGRVVKELGEVVAVGSLVVRGVELGKMSHNVTHAHYGQLRVRRIFRFGRGLRLFGLLYDHRAYSVRLFGFLMGVLGCGFLCRYAFDSEHDSNDKQRQYKYRRRQSSCVYPYFLL